MKPTPNALWLLAGLIVLALFWPDFSGWWMLLGVSVGFLGTDLLLGRALPDPEVRRGVRSTIAVNRPAPVSISLLNATGRAVRAMVVDEPPYGCLVEGVPFPRELRLSRGSQADFEYTLVPIERGNLSFGHVVVLLRSPFGFWETRRRLLSPRSIRVYPDFSIVSSYLDLLAGQQTVQLGLRLAPRRGEGLEFHQLREYRPGDSERQIDWKATARRRALISREYQEERDQHVLFLIDSGRRMRTRDGRLSHFDFALNAMLLLAYVALRQGDTVGMKVFGHQQRWVPPQRGVAGVNVLLNASYDLHTGTEAADYLSAAEDVLLRQRKRSLIVLLTNLREQDQDLTAALKLLRRRHVVLVGNLREKMLDVAAAGVPTDFAGALRVAGTHEYLAARRQHHASCVASAHVLLDCTPEELPVAVVNAYWQIKRSGSL